MFRKFKYGIKNLISWFPVIWNDRWWDDYFIFVILRKKLIETEKNFRKHGCHVDLYKDADKIKKCIYILDRIIKDDYSDNVLKPYYRKYGEFDLTRKMDDKEKKFFINCVEREEILKQQDIDYLFDNMKKYILTWWD